MLAIALMVTACAGDSSSPTPTAPSADSGVTQWLVTQRFVSVSGPDNCWIRRQQAGLNGLVFPDLPMSITRAGGSITLEGSYFEVNYAGTANGSDFSATGGRPLEGGGTSCDGTSFLQLPGVSNLSGRFTSGDELTATEVNSYSLTSGEPVTYTWEWRATRQN
jgi:hypothetical protein